MTLFVLEEKVCFPTAGARGFGDKKIGAERGDPNLHSQPRLPGSVVGEASMRQGAEANKITRGTVPW